MENTRTSFYPAMAGRLLLLLLAAAHGAAAIDATLRITFLYAQCVGVRTHLVLSPFCYVSEQTRGGATVRCLPGVAAAWGPGGRASGGRRSARACRAARHGPDSASPLRAAHALLHIHMRCCTGITDFRTHDKWRRNQYYCANWCWSRALQAPDKLSTFTTVR